MYKQKKNPHTRKYNHAKYWLKRKFLMIVTAFMIGLSNSINEEDKSIFGNQHHIEHQDKID
jgi:hypothetical protein